MIERIPRSCRGRRSQFRFFSFGSRQPHDRLYYCAHPQLPSRSRGRWPRCGAEYQECIRSPRQTFPELPIQGTRLHGETAIRLRSLGRYGVSAKLASENRSPLQYPRVLAYAALERRSTLIAAFCSQVI
jgi:hypothetical protein